jgi:hypothetical protein
LSGMGRRSRCFSSSQWVVNRLLSR